MKAESNFAPVAPYELEFNGSEVDIVLYDNVFEEMSETGERYIYDTYRMKVRNRPSLIDDLDNNIDAWLRAAKDAEYNMLSADCRKKRDVLLTQSDWTQTLDAPITAECKSVVRKYRQALRDVTGQIGFPHNVVWPRKPEIISTMPEPVDVTVSGIVDILSSEFGVTV
ncbi:MAG: tail fiber assembly protein [Eubacteriales bacterium]